MSRADELDTWETGTGSKQHLACDYYAAEDISHDLEAKLAAETQRTDTADARVAELETENARLLEALDVAEDRIKLGNEQYEETKRERGALAERIRRAVKYADNRWEEWGDRAVEVAEILEPDEVDETKQRSTK